MSNIMEFKNLAMDHNRRREWLAKAEDVVDQVVRKTKHVLPYAARFCLVSTFIEDGIRMWFQWNQQSEYMSALWKMPYIFGVMFVLINLILQLVPSVLILIQKMTLPSCACLVGITILQVIAYNILWEVRFVLRVLALIGGLLLLLVEESKRSQTRFPGVPVMNSEKRTNFLQLAGRILLVFMFLSILHFTLKPLPILIDAIGSCLMILVMLGYKTKLSSMFLFIYLGFINVIMNPFWSVSRTSPFHDVLRYDFFQTLSVMGGLLYIVLLGPGGVSIDERKKQW